MKSNILLSIYLTTCIAILSFQSCKSDDDLNFSAPEIGVDYINYDCFGGETTEVFVVVENMPSYGSNDSALYDYLFPRIEISRIDEIIDGSINLRIVILNTGKTCLYKVMGTDVPIASLFGFDTLINEMPDWNPGTQRDTPVHVFQNINIKIVDGEFELNL